MGKALLQACAEDEDHWKLRDSCCPLGLAPIPTLSCTSAMQVSDSAHRFKGYH